MSPIIEKLLLQIAYVCLHITAQGRWHAHLTVHAHIKCIDVYLLPATTDYRLESRPPRAFSQAVYYQDQPGYDWQLPEQQEPRIADELRAMLEDLEPFLDVEQLKAKPEAPPSIHGIPPRMGSLDEVSVSAITALALSGGHAELLLTTRRQEVRVELTADRFDVPNGYALECLLVAHGQRHTLKLSPGDGIYAARLCEWVESIATGTAAAA